MGIDFGLRTVGDGKGSNCSMGLGLGLRRGGDGDVPTQSPDGKAAQSMCALVAPISVCKQSFLFNGGHLDDNDR